MSKGKRLKKKAQAAAKAAQALAAKKAASPPPKPKPVLLQCYEVHLLLVNTPKRLRKDVRQYFHQPKGVYQAIVDSLNFVHKEVERYHNSSDGATRMAVDRVEIFDWSLAIPQDDGEIATRRCTEAAYEWNFEEKLKFVVESLTKKQKRRVQAASVYLDKYRPMRSKVVIEEIGREIIGEPGVPLKPVVDTCECPS